MNKKLRLLVTTKCPNKCPMCCNNSWDFSSLPVVDRLNYEEIMITGGEPLLYVNKLCTLVDSIRTVTSTMGIEPKLYVYTSVCDWMKLSEVIDHVDGVVLTPHNRESVEAFKESNELINAYTILVNNPFNNKSLRLNLFPDIEKYIKDEDLSRWQVKEMKWIKDCPVPQGKDFRRIKKFW